MERVGWERVVQINEQCCIRKSNGKLKKQNRRKTCEQQKRLSKTDLVAIRKNKVTLMLNKLAYIGMCILELSKVLMY